MFVFDATVMPPKPKTHIDLSMGGHGWVTFSLDGKYAWSHTPDVIDARTNRLIWRGWAQHSVKDMLKNQDTMARQINEAVTRMFKEFPRAL